MKIYLYCNDKISVFYLPEVVSGSYSFDFDDEETAKLINVEAREGKWVLFETDFSKIVNSNSNQTVKNAVLIPYSFYVVSKRDKKYLIYVTNIDDSDNINIYSYNNDFSLVVGGGNSNVFYNCLYVRDLSFKIEKQNNDLLLLTINSGIVYINDKLLETNSYYIKNGDELNFFGVKIIFLLHMFIVIAPPTVFKINEDLCHVKLVNIVANHEFRNINRRKKD